MEFEQREAIRESNKRRAYSCPSCGSPAIRELTAEEIARRDDTLEGLRYRTCNGCGNTWTIKGRRDV